MIEVLVRQRLRAIPEIAWKWLLAAGSLGSFGWLMALDQVHPIFVYLLQLYLTI